jgi:uncharacterized protein YcgI (DUF1989 family)
VLKTLRLSTLLLVNASEFVHQKGIKLLIFAYKGPHPSCSDNLMNVMRRRGHEINVISRPINFFTNTNVQNDGSLITPKNIVKLNSYVVLESMIDIICVVSSCPFDISPDGWEINAGGIVTELEVEL